MTLSDPTAQKPTFTTPLTTQTLTFSLVVTDTVNPIAGSGTGGKVSTAATTTVSVTPEQVVASAGPDQTGKVAGNTITLDATGSTDPDNNPLTYTWAQVANGAPTVTLSDPNAAKPTFVVPPVTGPAGYVFQFNVTATNGGPNPQDTDTTATPVSITVGASTPTIGAPTKTRLSGSGSTFYVGDVVQLNPGTITNPDGNNPADYTYVWAQSSGRTTTLSSTTAQNPTFVVPPSGSGAGNTAVCTSGSGATSPTSANCPEWKVTVTKINTGKSSALSATLANYAATLPTRPVANAGGNQNVNTGSVVTLDGSASTQAQGHVISYAWTQTGGTPVTLSDPTAQKPTFTPAADDTYTFSLVVTDTTSGIVGSGTNGNTSTASTATVTSQTIAAPVADAGPDQNVHVGDTVTLDASGSSQAQSLPLTYSWLQTSGTPVTLSDATAAMPTFTAPASPDVLGFTVTVDDGQPGGTASDAVVVTVNAYPAPIANAGPDQNVHPADTVTLDGSGSSQANGHPLDYSWVQTSGTTVTLSDPTAGMPTFTAPAGTGSLGFTLTVTDSLFGGTSTDDVVVNVTPFDPPVANAGSDQMVKVLDAVTLDGTESAQTDGHPLSYSWSQTAGTTVSLSDATSAQPTFTAPITAGTLTFSLIVTDTISGATSTAETNVDVVSYAPPVADAGADQDVLVSTPVALDASASSQPDGHTLSYSWQQTAGTAVTLSDGTSATPTFTAPTLPTTLAFSVTVSDAYGGSATASVTVTVHNTNPIADAGPDQNVDSNTVVQLDGTGSSDPDGHTLTYSWAQMSGPAVTLSDATSAQPTFTAPVGPATITIQLTVDDGHGGNGSATVTVSVAGTAGLDLASTLKGSVTGEQAKSTFTATVQNLETGKRTVTNANIHPSIVVNGDPVNAADVVVTAKSANIKPGDTSAYKITWNHGDTLHAGDIIAVASCVDVPGDEHPENNCDSLSFPTLPISLSTVADLTSVKKSHTSDTVKVTVHNDGLGTITPLRVDDLTVTIQIGAGDPIVLTSTAARVAIGAGQSKSFSYKWAHAKLAVGTQVTATACLVVPGNTSDNSCSTVMRVVS